MLDSDSGTPPSVDSLGDTFVIAATAAGLGEAQQPVGVELLGEVALVGDQPAHGVDDRVEHCRPAEGCGHGLDEAQQRLGLELLGEVALVGDQPPSRDLMPRSNPRVSNALARDSRWQAATVSARIEHPGADQLIAEMATQLRLHRVGTDSRTHRSYAAIAVGLPWPSRK
jgi:hypothetical protein